ncbi:MAG TPA: serine--glyoxylate aminotransferase, partial [Ramlibacter sp.]|nr:serine--glyoxylate aminotransferase [Ramlibacter sp.]
HLGECNDLSLMSSIAGCEMGLRMAGVRLKESGTIAAMEYLQATAERADRPPQQG